jgi:phosphoribosyl-ATP pyrophosphohydrolase/phosphoribosyl-AMP cyclohydrolase
MKLSVLKFDAEGLLPVVVRDLVTGGVAMLAWANREAVDQTLATGRATFWSRSRGELWVKGETSGDRIEVVDVIADCDGDALLYESRLVGPACHTGKKSCFHRPLSGEDRDESENFDLAPLFAILKKRWHERPPGSYSTKIFEKGLDHVLKKVGEEASEVIVAMKNPDDAALAGEIADLLYHLAAAMTARGISAAAVNESLGARRRKEKP